MTRRSALLQKFVHILTAFTILMKGIAKLEHPHGYESVIAFLFASALYIAAITAFHDRLHHHARLLDASVLAIEAIITGVVAWISFREGMHWIPWLYVAASIGFTVALGVRLVKGGRGPATA